MGLGTFIKKAALGKFLGERNMQKLKDAINWLNAEPGRKRGISVVLLGLAAGLGAAGKAQWAAGLTTANDWIQTQLVPGMDVAGGIIGLWGLLHPFFEGHASNK